MQRIIQPDRTIGRAQPGDESICNHDSIDMRISHIQRCSLIMSTQGGGYIGGGDAHAYAIACVVVDAAFHESLFSVFQGAIWRTVMALAWPDVCCGISRSAASPVRMARPEAQKHSGPHPPPEPEAERQPGEGKAEGHALGRPRPVELGGRAIAASPHAARRGRSRASPGSSLRPRRPKGREARMQQLKRKLVCEDEF
ncbi:uncharacterized protein VTP21DRAFT_1563 [Calcarisporiella thermophila]|uniref:uncharacterized protein n=1 Tax=Calcarisporiella thermophila TaxID=911321 RepID=UPI00374439E4